MARQISEHAQVAKLIRTHLKAQGIIAKVRASTASMTSSVDINLMDVSGPVAVQVERWADQFSAGDFCGMTDCYNYRSGSTGPTVKFVFVNRNYSVEMMNAAWQHARRVVRGLADVEDCEITDRCVVGEPCEKILEPIADARFFNDHFVSPRDVAYRVLASRDDDYGFWRSLKPRVRVAA